MFPFSWWRLRWSSWPPCGHQVCLGSCTKWVYQCIFGFVACLGPSTTRRDPPPTPTRPSPAPPAHPTRPSPTGPPRTGPQVSYQVSNTLVPLNLHYAVIGLYVHFILYSTVNVMLQFLHFVDYLRIENAGRLCFDPRVFIYLYAC